MREIELENLRNEGLKRLIKWNELESATIRQYGEICYAAAEEAMKRNKINFDNIEFINDHSEDHTWGSNADRRYRKSAVKKAIHLVAANPLKYGVML